MRQNAPARWARPLSTTFVWLLAAASVVFWGLRLSAPAAGAPYASPASAPAAPDALSVARVLGALPDAGPAPAAPAASRFALQGVLAGSSHAGAALIAVDGRPARPYRVGSVVAQGYVLQSVAPRRAVLGPDGGNGGGLTLDMPVPGSR